MVNRGDGDVNLVAGWDPSVAGLGIVDGSFYNSGSDVDMVNDIFNVAGSFGNNNGSVYVGSRGDAATGADSRVVVGSRLGSY